MSKKSEIVVGFVGNEAIYVDSGHPFIGKINLIDSTPFIIFEEEALKLASQVDKPTLAKISLFERAFKRKKNKSVLLYVESSFLTETINQRTNSTMKRLCGMLNKEAIKKLKAKYLSEDSSISWEVWLLSAVANMTAEERYSAIEERG